MEKIKKYIENIRNFFNIGDIKTILITLVFILALAILCQGSTVEASSAYTELDSIRFAGTQYIDTGVDIFSTNNWEIEFQFSLNYLLNYNSLLGLDSGVTTWECWVDNNGYFYTCVNGKKIQHRLLETNQIYTIKLLREGGTFKYYLNGTNLGGSIISATIGGSLYFGHRDTTYSYLNLYSLKLTQDSILVRDYVPCADSVGTLGFYDKATDTIFYNGGTGNFLYNVPEGDFTFVTDNTTYTYPELPDNSPLFNDELFFIAYYEGNSIMYSFVPKKSYTSADVKVAFSNSTFYYTNSTCRCYILRSDNTWKYSTWQPESSRF